MNGWSTSPNRRASRGDEHRSDRQQYRDWLSEERPYEADDDEPNYNGRVPIRSDRAKSILAAVIQNELTDRERQILCMRYFQGMRPKEIAQELGVGIACVSQLSGRAKKKMYEFMKYSFM